MDGFADDVLVTSVLPYGDADCVLRLFTRTHGRVGAFARKARVSRRRFPVLMAPSLGRASLQPRHGADLMELKELDVDPAVLGFERDLRTLTHAAYVAELVERLLPEHEATPEIFALVHAAVVAIARRGAQTALLRAFELKLLLHLGYLPDLVHAQSDLALSPEARAAARLLLQSSLEEPLPCVDDGLLRAVSTLFAGHLRQHLGAPLKSVRFLAALSA